jgi:hypothetical protein
MMKLLKIAACLFCSAALLLLAGCGSTVEESIGGTVSGLSGGTSVVLQNNGGDALTVSADGSFTFAKKVGSGSTYNVTVETEPIGETCAVSNGSGTVSSSGAVMSVTVACTANTANYNYIQGTVSGLATGTSVTLQNVGVTSYVVSADGLFKFPVAVTVGNSYYVTVISSPAGKTCTVTNGTGTVPANGISTAIGVICN